MGLRRLEDWVLKRRNGTKTAIIWLELNSRSAFAAWAVCYHVHAQAVRILDTADHP
jgi:hypothetical protein